MNKFKLGMVCTSLILSLPLISSTILPMNRAFLSVTELLPFINDREMFMDQKNESKISEKLSDLEKTFKVAKHETILSHDLFAPSYTLVTENVNESVKAFKAGKKSYAHWTLQELTSLCLDCHTRLPESYSSSFQSGELQIEPNKFKDVFSLGVAQLIVRRYVDAKASFTRDIQDKLIKKDFENLKAPFQQILLIETKILKDPASMELIIDTFLKKELLPQSMKDILNQWKKRLVHWKKDTSILKGLQSEKELKLFMKQKLEPLKRLNAFEEGHKVDLLLASGILANYFFINQDTPHTPEISYWMGWIEKRLKREEFFGSGDYFLKQCIRKYPKHPIAKECLEEYKESVEFDFSGSGGTNIPSEVEEEIKELDKLVHGKGAKPLK
ncbi:MAG: hypothetical protein NDI69_14700 [Bacteriovoracaceae bacterium]|nr:hypothetical protein [Bacteriovoracaceae bacterium]